MGEKYGLINYLGDEILPFTCDYIRDDMSTDSILTYRTIEDTWSFIDLKTKKIIQTQFPYMEEFYEGFAAVDVLNKEEKKRYTGYINTSGELVIPAIYDHGDGFSGGIASVRKGELYGYIDQTGKAITPCEYTIGRNFYKGYALVNKGGYHPPNNYRITGGKWGIIDTKGNLITEMKFSHIGSRIDDKRIFVCKGSVYNETLQCETGGKFAILDLTTGEETTDYFRADEIEIASKDTPDLLEITIDKKKGLIDLKGNAITPVKYTYIGSFKEGYFIARIGNERYKLTPDGEAVKLD